MVEKFCVVALLFIVCVVKSVLWEQGMYNCPSGCKGSALDMELICPGLELPLF